jgi:nitrate reductase delta subunit
MALVRIKQDFRAAGVEVGDEELPDHLPLVLEFAAAHDATRGAKILRQNRPGLELLRLHLEEISSPWHGAVRAISATLPRLDADDRAAVVKLAQEGPEEETVGLDGYGAEVDTLDPDSLAGAAAMLAARSGEACGGHLPGAGGGPVPVELTTRGHGR